jgi:hypothetical protein
MKDLEPPAVPVASQPPGAMPSRPHRLESLYVAWPFQAARQLSSAFSPSAVRVTCSLLSTVCRLMHWKARPTVIYRPPSVRGLPSEFVYSFPLFVDGLPPASLKSLSCPPPRSTAHRPSSILPSAVRGLSSEFVYSFPLFVDGLPPASLKSLSRHRPRSTVRRPSSILPFAVCGPPSEFVYSFLLFVDGLPPASLKSLSCPPPRPSPSILPSAVRSAVYRSAVYRSPFHRAVCRPRSAV